MYNTLYLIMSNITDFKRKYDTIFDNLFFTNDFKQFCTEKMKRCPAGLTINTVDNDDEKYFEVCCKNYGYEFANQRIIGDYTLGEEITDEMYIKTCLQYLYENDKQTFDEVIDNIY